VEYQSNAQVSKEEISAKLYSASDFLTGAGGSAMINDDLKQASVNQRSYMRSNTYVPTDYCDSVSLGNYFDPSRVLGCIDAWLETVVPTSAYSAYAVPFEFHPQFRAALPRWESEIETLLSDSDADYRFVQTGECDNGFVSLP